MQTYGKVEIQLHTFITSAVNGGEWLSSRPVNFTSEERTPVSIVKEAE
jgi:hypothetical protein